MTLSHSQGLITDEELYYSSKKTLPEIRIFPMMPEIYHFIVV